MQDGASGRIRAGRGQKPRQRWPACLGGAVIALVLWLGGVTAYVAAIGARDDASPSDAIIVLGAAAYDARPSPVFEQRIAHAIALYRRGLAPRIVFTGGFGGPARFSESQVGQRYAVRHGVPAASILIETRSRTTRDNLAEAAALLRAQGAHRVIVVSDPAHLARALWLARREGLEAVGSPTQTSRFVSRRTRLAFLAREVAELHVEWWRVVRRHLPADSGAASAALAFGRAPVSGRRHGADAARPSGRQRGSEWMAAVTRGTAGPCGRPQTPRAALVGLDPRALAV